MTFAGSSIPDNKQYEFDVTQLVQEYVSGKYKNTGFFLKAKTESSNYIAFYSSEWSNAAQRPKLTVTTGASAVDNPPVANAGADKTATTNYVVTFDASASTDDQGITSYSWDFDVSNGITIDATTKTASKTYIAAGTYTVSLTVTDTTGQKSTDALQVVVTNPVSSVSYAPVYDNKLKESSPTTVLSTSAYIDIGGLGTASYRDVMWFDLSEYNPSDTISQATLSLYWYYPAGKTRTSDTIVEVYRPVEWDPQYVTWDSRISGVLWSNAGGSWYDKNGVAQGTTPYASLTFAGSKVPDNKYYDFEVTQLVQEYTSGTYENTGFFLKAKAESGNYIAFYSSEWFNADQRPKLVVTRV
jgi:PKD repeat protein